MLKPIQKQTPYIHVFKLSSGEEIITKVTEELHDGYMIVKPLTMVMGAKGFQFAPFMFLANTDVPLKINKSLIMGDGSAVIELENQYESVTTGIALPQKSSIII